MSLSEQTPYTSAGVHDSSGYRRPPGYAHWGKRVGAAVVDSLTLVPFYVLIAIVAIVTHSSHTATLGTSADGTPATVEVSDGVSGTGLALIGLICLAMLAFGLWNVVFRQGRTGRSIGKSVLGTKLVKESTGDVAGAASLSVGRSVTCWTRSSSSATCGRCGIASGRRSRTRSAPQWSSTRRTEALGSGRDPVYRMRSHRVRYRAAKSR